MIKLEGIQTFVTVAEQGSLSAAARTLGLSRSVVSERLSELERETGARLIQRTTRRMTLTEDGLAFLPRARRIARDVTDASAEMAERRGQLVGSLRISAPVSFGYLHLGPALYPFLQQHPGIVLELDVDDRFVDVEAGGYDAVIRHGPVRDGWLMAIRIAASHRRLIASPAYLEANATPRSISELEQHRAILYTNRVADWRFNGPGGGIVVHPQKALRVNNGLIMRDAAVAGMGLAMLPSFMVHTELSAGTLRSIDVGLEPEGAEIYLAYAKAQQPSAKLRALIDHLRRAFGTPPYWDVVCTNS
jgi:DNA-binding transcriptional LysR family regulator